MTKIIVSGSRSITDQYKVDSCLNQIFSGGSRRGKHEIITGGAHGVDELAQNWAIRYDCEYNDDFHLDNNEWRIQGRSAGVKRNQEMAEYVSPEGVVVCIWDGESTGTRDMISRALNEGIEVHVFTYDL